ncbi:MAG: glycoside hydrolase family 3 N-terminal domain-containing protein, partial [Burkholderiales bacterium]
ASRERLEQVELPPFRAAVEAGVGAVMTAHIYLPGLEPEAGLPATLSPAMTAGLLRRELGFQGLVFTDALTMQGVAARFTPEEVAVRAVKAGADILLIPVDIEKTVSALKRAVESGEITKEQLDASVKRILEAKARLGLHRQRFADLERLEAEIGALPHQRLARTMIERALTLVRDEKSSLPLRLADNQRLLYINLLDSRRGWVEGMPGRAFRDELLRRHANTVDVQLDDATSKDAFDILRKLAGTSDAIVVSGFIRVAAYKGSIDLSQWQLELLRDLSKLDKPLIFTLFGSPYLLSFVPELPAYALAFEDYPEAERAMVRAVFGEIPFTGHLPIS